MTLASLLLIHVLCMIPCMIFTATVYIMHSRDIRKVRGVTTTWVDRQYWYVTQRIMVLSAMTVFIPQLMVLIAMCMIIGVPLMLWIINIPDDDLGYMDPCTSSSSHS